MPQAITGFAPTSPVVFGAAPATLSAAPSPVATVTAIPTLSEWGVILLAGLVALFGLGRVRRRAQARR